MHSNMNVKSTILIFCVSYTNGKKKGHKSHQSSISTMGGGAIKSVVTGYKSSSWKIYSSCMKFHLSPYINTWCFTYKMSHIHKTSSFLAVLHLWPLNCDGKVWLPLSSRLMKINKISHILCIYSTFWEWHYIHQTFNVSQVQIGTKLTNLPGWYQCLVPSYNVASWDPPADMDAAAYQSDQYSLVVCPASFSDLLAASQVVACTVYNARDSIKCTYLLIYDSCTQWLAVWKSMIPS